MILPPKVWLSTLRQSQEMTVNGSDLTEERRRRALIIQEMICYLQLNIQ